MTSLMDSKLKNTNDSQKKSVSIDIKNIISGNANENPDQNPAGQLALEDAQNEEDKKGKGPVVKFDSKGNPKNIKIQTKDELTKLSVQQSKKDKIEIKKF